MALGKAGEEAGWKGGVCVGGVLVLHVCFPPLQGCCPAPGSHPLGRKPVHGQPGPDPSKDRKGPFGQAGSSSQSGAGAETELTPS